MCIGSAQLCCACDFFLTRLEVAVPVSISILFSRGSYDFSFLVYTLPFLFLFCFVDPDLSALESSCKGLVVGCLFSLDLSNVY